MNSSLKSGLCGLLMGVSAALCPAQVHNNLNSLFFPQTVYDPFQFYHNPHAYDNIINPPYKAPFVPRTVFYSDRDSYEELVHNSWPQQIKIIYPNGIGMFYKTGKIVFGEAIEGVLGLQGHFHENAWEYSQYHDHPTVSESPPTVKSMKGRKAKLKY